MRSNPANSYITTMLKPLRSFLDDAIVENPNIRFTLAGKVAAHLLDRNIDKAKTDLDKAVLLNPKNTIALATRGAVHMLLGNFESAKTDLDKAIGLKLKPNDAFALSRRGAVHLLQENLDLAKTDLDKAIGLKPNDAFALAARGDVHRLQGNFDLAKTDLDEALRFNPNNAHALTVRGDVYRIQGNFELAMIYLNNAIRVHPNHYHAFARRSDIYRRQGHLELAKIGLDKAIELYDNDDAFALSTRGAVHLQQGSLELAKTDLDKAFGANTNNKVHQVAKFGILSLIKYYFERDAASITKKDIHNKIPLYYATQQQHEDVVEYLAGKTKSCIHLIEVYRSIAEVDHENKCLIIIKDVVNHLVESSGITVPNELRCPISLSMILAPYQVGQHLYEKAAWMKYKKTVDEPIDPLTTKKNPFESDVIVVFIMNVLESVYSRVDDKPNKLNQSKKKKLVAPSNSELKKRGRFLGSPTHEAEAKVGSVTNTS